MIGELPATMCAAVLTGPERIDVRELPVPRPAPGELLLKVGAATTCGTDVKVYRRGGHPRMLKVPTVFGHEMAGTVAAVGKGVDHYRPGDRVVVANSAPCGVCDLCRRQRENLCEDLHYLNGAFAEYLLVPARFVARNTHKISNDLTFQKAALTEPLACVLHGISACELDRFGADGPVEIVIFGGGPIGQLFVAALSTEGHKVILADPNASRLEMARTLGAHKMLTIARDGGQTEKVRAATADGKGAWVAIDATGVPDVWLDAIQVVRPGGLVNLFGGCAPGTTIPLDTHLLHYSEITVKGVYHHRPSLIADALMMLERCDFRADLLITGHEPIQHTEKALRAMMAKEQLKVVVSAEGIETQ